MNKKIKNVLMPLLILIAVIAGCVIGGNALASGGEIESFELTPTVYPTYIPTPTPFPTGAASSVYLYRTESFRGEMPVGTKVSKEWFRAMAYYPYVIPTSQYYPNGYFGGEWVEVDYEILNPEITTAGNNYIFILIEGYTQVETIVGTRPMEISGFHATWDPKIYKDEKDTEGEPVVFYVGTNLAPKAGEDVYAYQKNSKDDTLMQIKVNPKNDFLSGIVTYKNANPKDSTEAEEDITTSYNLAGDILAISPKYLMNIGTNKITVTYAGWTDTIYVEAKPRLVYGIKAEYKGRDVALNHEVSGKDIAVTVIYADMNGDESNITAPTTDFYIVGGLICNEGNNMVAVYYKDPYTGREYVDTIIVNGVNRGNSGITSGGNANSNITPTPTPFGGVQELPDLNYGLPTNDIDTIAMNPPELQDVDLLFKKYVEDNPNWNPNRDTWLTLLTGDTDRANSIYIQMLAAETIKNAVNHVVDTQKFIGFHINYTDPEACLEFPMWGVAYRPDGYDPDQFAIYYTPDKKSTMAQSHGLFLDDDKHFYAFTVFEPGWYAMLEKVSDKKITSINVEKSEITLKVDRNYSLEDKVVVIPSNADNQRLEYTSSNPAVVSVDRVTGMIKTISEGEAYIFIESTDGSGVYKRIKIIVK